jgi:hypothetical protein
MTKILLLFPNYSLPQPVVDFGLQLARQQEVTLHGLFVNHLTPASRETYPFPNDIDSLDTDFTRASDEEENQRLEDSQVQVFETYCRDAAVRYEIKRIHHRHLDTLTDGSEFADLVIMPEANENELFSFKSFLTSVRCPVILVSASHQQIEQLVFAYDDRFPGMHALKMFSYLLPAFRQLPATFVSVVPPDVRDIDYRTEITSWLAHHYPQASIQVLQGNERDVLPAFIETQTNALVVMGAYGRSSLSLLFRESMANVVMQKTAASVFVAHE